MDLCISSYEQASMRIEETGRYTPVANVDQNTGKVKKGMGEGKGRRLTKKNVETVCITDVVGVCSVCTEMNTGPGMKQTPVLLAAGGRGRGALWFLSQKTTIMMKRDGVSSGSTSRLAKVCSLSNVKCGVKMNLYSLVLF